MSLLHSFPCISLTVPLVSLLCQEVSYLTSKCWQTLGPSPGLFSSSPPPSLEHLIQFHSVRNYLSTIYNSPNSISSPSLQLQSWVSSDIVGPSNSSSPQKNSWLPPKQTHASLVFCLSLSDTTIHPAAQRNKQ